MKTNLDVGVFKTPDETDILVAELKLKAMGIDIDSLTPKQIDYLEDWEEGT